MNSVLRALAAALCVAFLAGQATAASLTLLTEDASPPLNFTDAATGEFKGIATEIVRELMGRAGVATTLEVLPWQRAYALAQRKEDACLYATNETEERRPLFDWVGPLARGGWALFAPAGSPVKLGSLDDARALVIAVQQGSALADHLAGFPGLALDPAPDNEIGFRKLAAGRVDLIAHGRFAGPWAARELGIGPIEPVLMLRESVVAIACNKAVDDALIAKLNEILGAMHADGTVGAIMARYR